MSIEEREGRRPRSVRLTTAIDTRLVALCEHLGVTPNSYLVGVIGKAIATDEMAFLAKSNSNDMVKILESFASMASEEVQGHLKAKEVQFSLGEVS